jgi:hypothetical protein
MMPVNPKWQRDFSLAMLRIQNVSSELEQKWSENANQKTEQQQLPVQVNGQPNNSSQPIRDTPVESTGGESGSVSLLNGPNDQRPIRPA